MWKHTHQKALQYIHDSLMKVTLCCCTLLYLVSGHSWQSFKGLSIKLGATQWLTTVDDMLSQPSCSKCVCYMLGTPVGHAVTWKIYSFVDGFGLYNLSLTMVLCAFYIIPQHFPTDKYALWADFCQCGQLVKHMDRQNFNANPLRENGVINRVKEYFRLVDTQQPVWIHEAFLERLPWERLSIMAFNTSISASFFSSSCCFDLSSSMCNVKTSAWHQFKTHTCHCQSCVLDSTPSSDLDMRRKN